MSTDRSKVEQLQVCAREIFNEGRREPESFGQLIREVHATSEDLAELLTFVSSKYDEHVLRKARPVIEAHITVTLTREHVRAQERMSASAGFLAAASVFLAMVSLIGSCS
ncbi:MAG TPA: hypothetical protein VGD45_20280 [Steroidobacter sp.]